MTRTCQLVALVLAVVLAVCQAVPTVAAAVVQVSHVVAVDSGTSSLVSHVVVRLVSTGVSSSSTAQVLDLATTNRRPVVQLVARSSVTVEVVRHSDDRLAETVSLVFQLVALAEESPSRSDQVSACVLSTEVEVVQFVSRESVTTALVCQLVEAAIPGRPPTVQEVDLVALTGEVSATAQVVPRLEVMPCRTVHTITRKRMALNRADQEVVTVAAGTGVRTVHTITRKRSTRKRAIHDVSRSEVTRRPIAQLVARDEVTGVLVCHVVSRTSVTCSLTTHEVDLVASDVDTEAQEVDRVTDTGARSAQEVALVSPTSTVTAQEVALVSATGARSAQDVAAVLATLVATDQVVSLDSLTGVRPPATFQVVSRLEVIRPSRPQVVALVIGATG